MPDYQIQHQPEESLFFVYLDDGQRAFIRYRLSGNESATAQVDFFSTFVPESYRSLGLAAELVEHAFNWANEKGMDINTSCWYAAKILEQRLRSK